MPDRPNVLKATIYGLTKSGSVDNSKKVECHFNPKQFEIKGKFQWVEHTSIGSDHPQMTFAGGQAQDLDLDFLFDTTDKGTNVRDAYKPLLEIAAVDSQQQNDNTGMGQPPNCRFQWGKLISFNAVITEIVQTFTMFKADGTPLRAKVKVTFKRLEKPTKGQNPTSHSLPRKTWLVREGERLDWIAYQEYGDPAYWRHIAETNNLIDPQDLHPGQVLNLVPLS